MRRKRRKRKEEEEERLELTKPEHHYQQVKSFRNTEPRIERATWISLCLDDRESEMKVYKGHAQAPSYFH